MLRAAALTAVGLALVAAGCTGTTRGSPVASITDAGPAGCRPHCVQPATPAETVAAAKAARCMRSHGVPSFPDPNSLPGLLKGHFGYMLDSGLDPNSSVFKAAEAYCESRYIHFPTVSPAQKARWHLQALAFSACMRTHGATDFPDPDAGGAIYLPTAYYMRTPAVARARQRCQSLLTGKGFVFVSPVP